MKIISKYSKSIPYFYFIAVVGFWFTDVNKVEGAIAFPILLFTIPCLWQIIKPKSKLSSTFGITLICLSVYLISAYVLGFFNITSMTSKTTDFVIYGGVFVILISAIDMWWMIIRNSLRQSF